MASMRDTKNPMPTLDPKLRVRVFDEVATGCTAEIAVDEAKRCLNCKNRPCVLGCPVRVDIPEFIRAIADGDFHAAHTVLYRQNSLPAVCGRVCPQEIQCESQCVRGRKGEPVAIGRLERFAADWHRAHAFDFSESAESGADCAHATDLSENAESSVRCAHASDFPKSVEQNGYRAHESDFSESAKLKAHRAAIIGSGPAGLACAGELTRRGWSVTVWEALHELGGVLTYGIPQFRLPKEIVRDEVNALMRVGVRFETDAVIGRTLTIDELFGLGFEAVFIGTGAGLPRFMGIPGENLNGVFSANEFLTRVNLMRAAFPNAKTPVYCGENVAVIGGGNVAMDAARCAKRLGAENVTVVYRRSMNELPARREEVEHAREEGIAFKTLCNPIEIIGEEGRVNGMKCVEMTLGEPDASDRRRPIEKPDSEFSMSVDTVILALGTSPNPLLKSSAAGLETDARGCIVTRDETGVTSLENVYAGGDAVTGAATVILAMGAGKRAAEAMDAAVRK